MTHRNREQSQLRRIVARVRRRWRARQVLQGLSYLALTAVAVVWVSGVGLERARFAPSAIVGLRVLGVVALGFVAVRWVLLPLLKRVSQERVALYMEEHDPALGEALLTAVAAPGDDGFDEGSLQAGLVQQAARKARAAGEGRNIERSGFKRSAGLLAIAAAAAVATLLLGPNYLRHGASALFFPTVSATDANPYRISVQPGDATVSRGSDQVVEATLLGFSGADVTLFRRAEGGETFEPLAMIPTDSTSFEALLFELGSATEYFVESTGVRSPTFRIEVADLPFVDRLKLVYHFPAYTGLPAQTIEDGGDIAVLRGTRIEVRAVPTLPTPAGAVVFADSTRAELSLGEEGVLEGSFEVTQPGAYGIEFITDQGLAVVGSPNYAIDVLEDQPPSISIKKPGRDSSASAIEEVYIEVEGRDDYGVASIELVYSVNGGEENTERIFATRRAVREASAGHTFFLEDFELEPGDFVAYYARARDNDSVNGRKTVSSDMYFLQIRSFEKEFVQAEQMGGGGQGGGPEMESGLPEQQRQIISGTFNVNRDRERYTADEFAENVVTVSLAQGRLIEQVDRLVEQMKQRGISQANPAFNIILEELPKAVAQMRVALDSLNAQKPRASLPPEQRALQHLLRAEEAYQTVQVSQGQQSSGGGAGSAAAEDLADLFQLELDQMKNQYETVQRQSDQQTEAAVDETLERLKELARRQEQAAERQRRLAQQGGGGGSGAAGEAQRELAEQTEEAARQLERLARENGAQELAETARQLRDAAQSMRQSAGNRGNASAGQAREALEQLREARRLLEKSRAERPAQAAREAVDRVEQLVARQRQIRAEVSNMPVAGDRPERMNRLAERKEAMEQEVADLERELDRASREANRDPEQRDAARGLAEAANWIRDSKLKEKIRYTRAVIQNRPDQTTRPLEIDIEGDLERLAELTGQASASVKDTGAGEASDAMDRTRDLVRGLQSLDERLANRAEEQRLTRRLAEAQNGQGQQPGPQDAPPGQEGQGGAQPGQTQGAQPGGEPGGQQGGVGQQGGMSNGAATGGRATEPLTEDEIRQLRREFRERAADADALRAVLDQMGEDTGDLDELIRGLRQMDSQRVYVDVEEIQRLQAALLEVAKRFEFSFRRRVEGDHDELLLRGSEEVPPGFEERVEEYYRALARGRRR